MSQDASDSVVSDKKVPGLIDQLEDFVNAVARGQLIPNDKLVIGRKLIDALKKDKRRKNPTIPAIKNDEMVRYIDFVMQLAEEAIASN